jgi:Flp pilus assembly pilin Flp
MGKRLTNLVGDTGGVTALEYALIAALVAVVIIGGVSCSALLDRRQHYLIWELSEGGLVACYC